MKYFSTLFFLLFVLGSVITTAQKTEEVQYRIAEENLDRPSSVYVTPRGEIYVTERGRHRLLKFNLMGERLDAMGNQGLGAFQFDRPLDVDATNGLKIYIADFNNRRVQVYDNRFQYLSTIRQIQGARFSGEIQPSSLTTNPMSDLFIYDENRHRILKYNTNGIFEFEAGLRGTDIHSVTDMSASQDFLFILDKKQQVIQVLNHSVQIRRFLGGWNDLKAISSRHDQLLAIDGSELIHMNIRGSVQNRIDLSHKNILSVSFYGRNLAVITDHSLFIYDLPFLEQFR
ncbi:MAG: NHL repeat-containing protein [Balneolaceae bacterium]